MAKIPIILEPGRADGKLVTSGAIFDENKKMFQSEINDIQDTLNSDNPNKPLSANQGRILKGIIDAKVIEAGAVPIDAEPIEGNTTHVVNSDGLAKEFNKCNTEIILGGIYDVSSHNDGAVFGSLQALLSSSNLNTLIPISIRHGGMSIRFIQDSVSDSDNNSAKYVQYRLMANEFSATPADWQGVDEEPTNRSENLVKSGGVLKRILDAESKIGNIDVIFNITKSGEHSSNLDRLDVNIPAGDFKIKLENVTSTSSGATNMYVHYVGDDNTTHIGGFTIGASSYKTITAKHDIDSIGFYILSAGIGTMKCNIVFDTKYTTNTYYKRCSTEGSEPNKTVDIDGYVLSTKLRLLIAMTNANTANNPTLNISGTEAKPIYYNGSPASVNNTWQANEVLDIYYSSGDDAYMATTHIQLTQDINKNSKIKTPSQFAVRNDVLPRNLTSYIIGKGSYISDDAYILGLKAGKEYIIELQDASLLTDTTSDTTTTKFRVDYEKTENNFIPLINYLIGGGDVPGSISVTIPNDLYYNGRIRIVGRAVAGKIVNFSIYNVSLYSSIGYPSLEPELYNSNVFNRSTAENSKRINNKGVIIDGDCIVSDYILCAGKDYISTNYAGRSNVYHAFYDFNKNLISVVPTTQKGGYKIPKSAYYVRLTLSIYSTKNYAAFVNSTSLSDNDFVEYKTLQDKVSDIDKVKNYKVINYNQDKISAIVSSVSRSPLGYEKANKNQCFAFSVITDLHSDVDRFERACAFSDEIDEIVATLCLGDIINYSNAVNPYPLILNYAKPIIPITGNHEVFKKTSSSTTGWDEAALLSNMYSSDLVAHNGEVHPEGKCYWYKDFTKTVDNTTKTLRVIGLHQYEGTGTGEQNSGAGKDVTFYSQEQIDWLIARLNECDSNTYVMLLIHYAPTANLTRVECQFTPSASFGFPLSGGSKIGGPSSMSDDEFIPKIIQAWIDGGSVNASCDITVGETVTTITANSTFSSSHAGKFVGYVTGHTHKDFVGKLANYPKQLVFSFICTSANDLQQSCDIGRLTSGKTQDCFTIISVDWFRNSVNLIRIGADVTTDMRERKYCNIQIPE